MEEEERRLKYDREVTDFATAVLFRSQKRLPADGLSRIDSEYHEYVPSERPQMTI